MSSTQKKSAAYLDEPKAGRLTIAYAPTDGVTVIENPPRFMWLPVIEDEANYVLRIAKTAAFDAADTHVFSNIPLNFFTPDTVLEAGHYCWSYAVWDEAQQQAVTAWSTVREFELAKDAIETPLVSRAQRYKNVATSHPRLLLSSEKITAFQKALAENPSHCTWDTFFEKSVLPWLERPVMDEPKPYPNNTRVAPIWRQTYIDCQELIYAIRHLAIAGKVLEKPEYLEKAKDWLLAAAAWDPEGSTSRAYTDEWAYRVTVALAWGYDWLHSELSEEERTTVRGALLARTRQIADHAIKSANIHLFPYDSHAVRSVYAVIIPACITMWDEEPEAKEWLDYSIEFLSTVYTPWGDDQGGWAEGPHYWMTAMAYLVEAANLMKSYMGYDLYQRPFFQNTADFAMYTKAPDTKRATFGDDSTLGDAICLKIGYNVRQFAGVTGNPAYQWYYDEIKRNDPDTAMAFYNYGWWDFNFDELMYQHDFPVVEGMLPANMDKLRWFKGTGWVAIQHAMDKPDQHVHFVMKSSSYGSISHSHGDQNAFCMSAFGEDLAIQSGYYVAFGSDMHQKWRRQTRSKNAILINGKGQYADRDKSIAMRSTGKIIEAKEHDDHIYIKGDATPAYQHFNPSVTNVEREIYFVQNNYFVIIDSVDATEAVEMQWLIHSNGPFDLGESSFRYSGEKAGFYGQFIWSEGGSPKLTQAEGYDDVNPDEHKGLPIGSSLSANFPATKRHRIVTLLVPYRLEAPQRIFSFLDDQGYDCDLYFTDSEERTFKIVIHKLARATLND